MIFTLANLPKSYQPYKTLIICSNTLIGGGHIASVGDVLPLIIGKGEKPQIWLQALSDQKKKKFLSIIENSVSKHPAVKVLEDAGSIVVSIQGETVLSIRQGEDDSALVDTMDLRPIGLNLYGNSSSMSMGESTFSGNSMEGGKVFIRFDG